MIKLNLDKINRAIRDAFDVTVDAQSDAFDRAMTDDVWEWPNKTRRRNGTIVGTPRDIVDTEELLDSKSVARSTDGSSAQYTWDCDHAERVLQGETLKSGVELPGRDWIAKGIEDGQPAQVFEQQLRKRLS